MNKSAYCPCARCIASRLLCFAPPHAFPLVSMQSVSVYLTSTHASFCQVLPVQMLLLFMQYPGYVLFSLLAGPTLVHSAPNPYSVQNQAQTSSLLFPKAGIPSNPSIDQDASTSLPYRLPNLATTFLLNTSSPANGKRDPVCDGAYFGDDLSYSSCWQVLSRLHQELSPKGRETRRIKFGTIHGPSSVDVIVPRRISSRK